MNEQQVFINFVPQDLETAHQIREKLEAENISCYMLPAVEDMETHFKVVLQIESMIDAKGAIVTIVSREALKNNWIISNAQYSCELAGRRTMLVIYQIEEIPQNNPLALYYAQAAVINASRKTDTSFSKLVNNVKRILQRTDVPDTFRPRRIPQKIIKRIVVITAVLGMLLGIGNYFLQMISEANRNLPQVIATPVIFDDPFSGESLDQGIIIDRRYVPESMPPGNPQAEAPFHFQPEYIYKRFSFDNPALENVNAIDEGSSPPIPDAGQYIIQQTNGVLQYAIAPQINGGVGNSGFHEGWPYFYLIQTGDFEYMGLRFRIDDYQGWSDENNLNMAYINLTYSESGVGLSAINLTNQSIETTGPSTGTILLGSDWHVLEFIPDTQSGRLNIFLDGELIDQSGEMPDMNTFARLDLWFDILSSTDWITLSIHEVIFGGQTPKQQAVEAEDAAYYITPDEILNQYTFDVFPSEDMQVNGQQYIRVSDGKLKFNINDKKDNSGVALQIPIKPISEMNYFSMRYRYTDYQKEYWSEWGRLWIWLRNPYFKSEIGVAISRYGADYTYKTGNHLEWQVTGSTENFQPEFWHTMEMVIKPLEADTNRYLLQYWHDGCLVGEHEIEHAEYYLSDTYNVDIEINPGIHSQQNYSGEIDEITIGFIAFPGLEQ